MDTSTVVPFSAHIPPSLAHAAPQSAAERELEQLRARVRELLAEH